MHEARVGISVQETQVTVLSPDWQSEDGRCSLKVGDSGQLTTYPRGSHPGPLPDLP